MIKESDIFGKVADVVYADDCQNDMQAISNGQLFSGGDAVFPGCENMFKWFPGHTISVGGHGNHGKSTFVIFLAVLKSIADGTKWCFYTPENDPLAFFYFEVMNCFSGKSPYHNARNPLVGDEKQAAYEWVKKHIFIHSRADGKRSTYKEFMTAAFKLYETEGVTGFVADPFNKFDLAEMERKKFVGTYILDYLDDYKRLATKTGGYSVTVIHPGSGNYIEKGGADLRCPTAREWEFGAQWEKSCDDAFLIHRPTKISDPENNDVLLRVLRNKKASLVGNGGDRIIQFDRRKRRYYYNGHSGFAGDSEMPQFEMTTCEFEPNTDFFPDSYIEPQRDDDLPF